MDRPRLPRRALGLALLVVSLATACAGGGAPTGAGQAPATSPAVTTPAAFPITVQATNGPVQIAARPARIVSLSPTATEMLFAIGAGSQVAAVDSNSNFPVEAPLTKLSAYQPNVEAIAKYRPDLVVISNDIGGLLKALGKLSIPTLLEPAAAHLDDTYAQLQQLGTATGHGAEAAKVVASMKTSIQRIVASAPAFASPPTYYYELDQTYYSVTSATFIGQLFGLLGLRSIADRAKGAAAADGYPQLSAEYIVKADPSAVFLADTKCCGQSARTVARRPGWKQMRAVNDGAVFALDDDVASRWGPRVVDLLRTVAQDLQRVPEPSP
jgi:iron complex transport system substrate-binding protein